MNDCFGCLCRERLAIITLAAMLALYSTATRAACIAPAVSPPQRATIDEVYKNDNPPAYPPASLEAGTEGEVELVVGIGADGVVSCIDVVRSSRNRDLDRAAIEAARRWRYIPALSGGRQVEDVVQVAVPFKIDGTAVPASRKPVQGMENSWNLVEAAEYETVQTCKSGKRVVGMPPVEAEAFCACYGHEVAPRLILLKQGVELPWLDSKAFLENAVDKCRAEAAAARTKGL